MLRFFKNGLLITGTATDFDGNYKIDLDPGTYEMEPSYVGYGMVRINGVIVRAGQVNRLDVTLGNGDISWFNNRRLRKNRAAANFEFHSPEEKEVVREILKNEPKRRFRI